MINVIIPIVENVEKYEDFIKSVNSEGVRFLIGIKESLVSKFTLSLKNIEIRKFADKSNCEEIINSLHSFKMKRGKLLIVRRAITPEEYKLLINSKMEIATLKASHNKFVATFKKIARAIVKKFFAFSYFEDISAICYSESMFEILSVCSNLSLASRVNKYVGVEIEEITTTEKPVKKQYNKAKNILNLTLGILVFLGSVAGGILVCIFTNIQALIVVLVIFWIFVSLVLLGVSIINYTRTVAVGNLRFGRAQEIA